MIGKDADVRLSPGGAKVSQKNPRRDFFRHERLNPGVSSQLGSSTDRRSRFQEVQELIASRLLNDQGKSFRDSSLNPKEASWRPMDRGRGECRSEIEKHDWVRNFWGESLANCITLMGAGVQLASRITFEKD